MEAVKGQTLLIDGDDTLWKVQTLYQHAERQFRDLLAPKVGESPEVIQAKFDEINRRLMGTMGFQEARYPLAMDETYLYFANEKNLPLDPTLRASIRKIGESVFSLMPDPTDGAKETLDELTKHYTLILYSGGDETVQLSRLKNLGLNSYFSGTWIKPQKNENELRALIAHFSLEAQNTWVIGDSPRFDIAPAIHVGVRAIWLYSELWGVERQALIPVDEQGELAPYATIFNLREVVTVLNSFPSSGSSIEERLTIYATMLRDQQAATSRRQNLTNVFIGLNTVALSGLAFLLASVRLNQFIYFDIGTAILITSASFLINMIYARAMSKYDDLVTVYAIYLRMIEKTLENALQIHPLNKEGTAQKNETYNGVMTVIGDLRHMKNPHWWNKLGPTYRRERKTKEIRRTQILKELKRQMPGETEDQIEKFARNVPFNVEGWLAKLFVWSFGAFAGSLILISVLFLLGIIQYAAPIFSSVPAIYHVLPH